VLIFAVEVLSPLDVAFTKTLPEECLIAVVVDVFMVGHGEGYRLVIDNFVFEMFELKYLQ
jgi:hypothetical protein